MNINRKQLRLALTALALLLNQVSYANDLQQSDQKEAFMEQNIVTLKGSPVRISGSLPRLGIQAQDFVLIDKDLKKRSLKDYSGKRKLISIVPSLDTAVCSLSAKKFNQAIKENPQEGVVLNVSADLPFAQSRFCHAEEVDNIICLSTMGSKDFSEGYGILMLDGPLANLCARAIVVLDENDTVIYTELVPEITQEPNYDKALEHFFKK
ncbi:Thiol peroxidase [Candidatus Rhabdochlamydia sp. T3358]|jgi:thiol peroxidase|nr:thiol peroxidase [Candidatus Rhabdochlamydia sp. T3358]VHO03133.1 Thiol peroxidase [Candidatus Rhabdochlamydia sp. T3358]